MSEEPKLCIQCRNFSGCGPNGNECRHPKLKSLIDGLNFPRPCKDERSTGLCGPDGNNYEVERRNTDKRQRRS